MRKNATEATNNETQQNPHEIASSDSTKKEQ